ncbi:MAG: M20 family metallopeptidase [Rikenellaceae bacterium]
MKRLVEKATELLPQIIEWRRYIHRNAELSFEEYKTQRYIMEVLTQLGIPHRPIAGTGVLAMLDGENPTPLSPVVLRADIDALPITEQTGLEFASTCGVMHGCGHDMHTASLLGALALLAQERFEGTIWGLFQPGEELHPGGASIVLKDEIFKRVTPRHFFGLHCSPELPVGMIGLCPDQFMASTDELHITVEGKGGHAAMPHLINDTVLASSAMVVALQQIVSRRANSFIPTVISFGRFDAAGATNIIPSQVVLEGTFRTMDEPWRAQVKELIGEIATQTVSSYGCTAQVNILDGYPSVINDRVLTERAKSLATELFGAEGTMQIPRRMTAEDFGFYAARYPSLFFRLGTGDSCAPLHNSRFSPDESALSYGSSMMAALALDILTR